MSTFIVSEQMNHLSLRNRKVIRQQPQKKLKVRAFGTELASINNAQIVDNNKQNVLRKRKYDQTSACKVMQARPHKRTKYNLRSRKIMEGQENRDDDDDSDNDGGSSSGDEDIDIAAIKNNISKQHRLLRNNRNALSQNDGGQQQPQKKLRRSARLRKKQLSKQHEVEQQHLKLRMIIDTDDCKEKSLLCSPFKLIASPELSEYDMKTISTELMPSEYMTDIIDYYRQVEDYAVSAIGSDYFSSNNQSDLHCKMRCILLDWMFNVCRKFKLCDRTLFLSVYALDMYLSKQNPVEKKRLQLIACVCIWVASKYHEIYAPEAGDFVFISANSFELNDLLKYEEDVLCQLQFNFMDVITPLHFSERFIQICQWPLHKKYSARGTAAAMKSCELQCTLVQRMTMYITQLTLLDCHIISCFKPSKISAACLCFAVLSISLYKQWPEYLAKETGYEIQDLRILLNLINTVRVNSNSKFNSIRKKFKCLNPWFDRLNIDAILSA